MPHIGETARQTGLAVDTLRYYVPAAYKLSKTYSNNRPV
jgi:transposase